MPRLPYPISGIDDPLGQVPGGLLLLAWAALFAVLGAVGEDWSYCYVDDVAFIVQ